MWGGGERDGVGDEVGEGGVGGKGGRGGRNGEC